MRSQLPKRPRKKTLHVNSPGTVRQRVERLARISKSPFPKPRPIPSGDN
jgi:hypothetical protein